MSKKERLGMGWSILVGALYVVLNGVVRTLNGICRLYEPPCDYLVGRSFVIAFSSLTLVSIIVAIIYSFQGKCKKTKRALLVCITSWMCYVLFQMSDSLFVDDIYLSKLPFISYPIYLHHFSMVFDDILMLGVVMVLLFLLPKLQKKGQRIACGVWVVVLGLFLADVVYFNERVGWELIVANTVDFVLSSLPYLFFAIFVSDSLLKSESRNCVPKVRTRETVVARFCSSCGNPLSAGGLYCASCGARCMRNTKSKKNCFLLSVIACGLNAITICILPQFRIIILGERKYEVSGVGSIAWFFGGSGCLGELSDGVEDVFVVFGILLLFVLGSIIGIYFTRIWWGMMIAAGVYLVLYLNLSGFMYSSFNPLSIHRTWTLWVHMAAIYILFLAIYLDHLRTLRIAKTNQMVRKSYCISVMDILTMVFMGVLLVLAVIGWCVG